MWCQRSSDAPEEAGAKVTGGRAGRAQHGVIRLPGATGQGRAAGRQGKAGPMGRGRAAGRQGKAGLRQGPHQKAGEVRPGMRLPERPALNTGPRGCSQVLCGAADGEVGVQEGRARSEMGLCLGCKDFSGLLQSFP